MLIFHNFTSNIRVFARSFIHQRISCRNPVRKSTATVIRHSRAGILASRIKATSAALHQNADILPNLPPFRKREFQNITFATTAVLSIGTRPLWLGTRPCGTQFIKTMGTHPLQIHGDTPCATWGYSPLALGTLPVQLGDTPCATWGHAPCNPQILGDTPLMVGDTPLLDAIHNSLYPYRSRQYSPTVGCPRSGCPSRVRDPPDA